MKCFVRLLVLIVCLGVAGPAFGQTNLSKLKEEYDRGRSPVSDDVMGRYIMCGLVGVTDGFFSYGEVWKNTLQCSARSHDGRVVVFSAKTGDILDRGYQIWSVDIDGRTANILFEMSKID